jgi:hypothetical protein
MAAYPNCSAPIKFSPKCSATIKFRFLLSLQSNHVMQRIRWHRISERSAGRINLESQLILSVNTDHGRLELQLYSTGTIRRPADSSRNCWTGHAGSLLSHVKPAGVLDAGWLQFCCLANSCQLIKRILFSWNVLEKPHISIVTDTIILSIVS